MFTIVFICKIGNGQARERADLIGLKTRGFQEYNFNLPNEINRNLHMMNNNNQSHLKVFDMLQTFLYSLIDSTVYFT